MTMAGPRGAAKNTASAHPTSQSRRLWGVERFVRLHLESRRVLATLVLMACERRGLSRRAPLARQPRLAPGPTDHRSGCRRDRRGHDPQPIRRVGTGHRKMAAVPARWSRSGADGGSVRCAHRWSNGGRTFSATPRRSSATSRVWPVSAYSLRPWSAAGSPGSAPWPTWHSQKRRSAQAGRRPGRGPPGRRAISAVHCVPHCLLRRARCHHHPRRVCEPSAGSDHASQKCHNQVNSTPREDEGCNDLGTSAA